jgi:hypothetical protein
MQVMIRVLMRYINPIKTILNGIINGLKNIKAWEDLWNSNVVANAKKINGNKIKHQLL